MYTHPHPLRVLFDTEIFGRQRHGGISRYYVELIKRLPQFGVVPRVVAPITFNRHLDSSEVSGYFGVRASSTFATPQSVRLVSHLLRLVDQVSVRALDYDILHHTYYNRRLRVDGLHVATVVDMIPELFPDYFPSGNPHGAKLDAIRSANLVFTISQCTKRDLLKIYGPLLADVVVTPLAVDYDFFASRATGQEDGTILFVGDRGAYKNFATFANAAAQLLVERLDYRVLCIGGGPPKPAELAPFQERGVARRVHHRAVSDAELPSIYRRASAFVFPSKYEGFGLPILEAFASGCPAIIADASCFPEVAADAAIYFNPDSVEELLNVLRRTIGDAGYRNDYRARGAVRAKEFTWERTAERTATAYREALTKRR